MNPRDLAAPELIDHLLTLHHQPIREALPGVNMLAEKVARVHGEHNPSLRQLHLAVVELTEELVPHLDHEEKAVFPVIGGPEKSHGSAPALLAAMSDDHQVLRALLDRVRSCADGFEIPDWACNSYRRLFTQLQQLETQVGSLVAIEEQALPPRFAPPQG